MDQQCANGSNAMPDSGLPREVSESQEVRLTGDELAVAKQYGRRELVCTLLDLVIDVGYLGVMAFWGARLVDRVLAQASAVLAHHVTLRLACLYLSIMALHHICSFPLSLYSGFILEHQYGLSRQSFWRWLRRYALLGILLVALGLVLVEALFLVIWWAESWWWLLAALGVFSVTVLLGQLVPVVILPLFYKIERLDDDDLRQRFERLASGTSLSIEGVYRMKVSSETAKVNALLTGLGRTRRVMLGDTLLDGFNAREIEVVFAHEVAHHVFHHMPKMILLGLAYSAVSFFVCDVLLVAWVTAVDGTFRYADCPVHALGMIMFVMTLFSLALSPLRNGVSRQWETACDRYALAATGDAEAYRSAFTRMAKLNKADPDPHPLEVVLFHDHPPIAARLAVADEDRDARQR